MEEALGEPIGWLVLYYMEAWESKTYPGAFMVKDPRLGEAALRSILDEMGVVAHLIYYVREKSEREAKLDLGEMLLGKSMIADCSSCSATGRVVSRTNGGLAPWTKKSASSSVTRLCRKCCGRGINVEWGVVRAKVLAGWFKDGSIPLEFRSHAKQHSYG